MANLSVYNLGSLGVNVDKDFVHLEDGELTSAQNAIKDPLGVVGGITKRLGLINFNSSASGGTIAGGVGVPLPFTRRIYIAQFSGGGANFLSSTTGFTTAATQSTTPSEPVKNAKLGSFYNAITSSNGVTYGKNACNYGNAFIYAVNNYTQGTTAPTLFLYDGSMDRLLLTVPTNTDVGVVSQTVMWMLINSNYLYFSVHDSGTDGGGGASTFVGSVYRYDLNTNTIIKLGATFPTGYLPYTLCWANDRLWVGTVTSAGEGGAGKVYWIRPGVDTTWTLDKTFGSEIFPTTILSFNGELYVGTYTTAGGSATVDKRSTAGVWSTVDTAGGTVPTTENFYAGFIQFSTSLYVGFTEIGVTGSRIRKFDGSSWTTAKTSSNSVAYNTSFIDNSVIYFWSTNTSNTEAFLSSANGSAWTDRTTNITPGGNRAGTGAAVIVI